MAIFSCRKEDPAERSIKADDARYLMSNLVFVDENDIITGYMTGFGLNQADPGQISIPCETLEQARDIFLGWIPDYANPVIQEERITWNMTDSLGVSQGAAILVPGGNTGAVAHLELPDRFPGVTGVQFLPASSMPTNAELDVADELDDFFFLNVVDITEEKYPRAQMKSYHGNGKFLVIREFSQKTNTSGILLATPDEEHSPWYDIWTDWEVADVRARETAQLQVVSAQYRKYPDVFDNALKELGYASGDHWFLCWRNPANWTENGRQLQRFNLRSQELQDRNGFHPYYYEAKVYFFSVEKSGDSHKLILN
jgi:hypothetical protein